MTKFFIIYKNYLVLFLCLLTSTSLIFSNQAAQVESLRSIILDMSSSITNRINYVSLLFNTMENNRLLTEENLILNYENSLIKEIIEENERLRSLIELKNRAEFEYKAGEIISWNPTPTVSSVTVNLGSDDGVEKNMPVISDNGLVGKIVSSEGNTSICQLLTDRNFRVSSKLSGGTAIGILEFMENDLATMKIAKSLTVQIGDTVYTSSHGNIYPEGIHIGTVMNVEEEPGLFKNITVDLFVNYLRLRQVLVIVNNRNLRR
ncbi:MAG: rod shape-determining protein MreC [bacterium]|nr:rod shape-determining protein MreC [bacterium]